MSDCNHTIGLDDVPWEGYSTVNADQLKKGSKNRIMPDDVRVKFDYCPWCGIKLDHKVLYGE